MDTFDRKVLAALQKDGRLTNAELAEVVGLSASQCSRRRVSLEQTGVIRGYTAQIDAAKVGIELTSLISITLATHDEQNAAKLRALLSELPNVQDAYALTGEMDYSIKVVSENLEALSSFVNKTLLPHPAVQNVRTAIVLDTLKSTSALPLL